MTIVRNAEGSRWGTDENVGIGKLRKEGATDGF